MDFAAWRDEIFQLAGAGRAPEALALLRRAPADLTAGQRARAEFWAACLHCGLHEHEEALAALERIQERGDWFSPLRLRSDPDLSPLHHEVRFQVLLQDWEARLRDVQQQTRPELFRLGGREMDPPLAVLHENLSSAQAVRPLFAGITGWQTVLLQSGQRGGPEEYVWTDAEQADAAMQTWEQQFLVPALWAGFSAGASVAARNVLGGKVAARGILLVIPSLPGVPRWWPATPPALPAAFILGERDPLTPAAQATARRLQQAGNPVRVWNFAGGHQVPPDWQALRNEALDWLAQQSR